MDEKTIEIRARCELYLEHLGKEQEIREQINATNEPGKISELYRKLEVAQMGTNSYARKIADFVVERLNMDNQSLIK